MLLVIYLLVLGYFIYETQNIFHLSNDHTHTHTHINTRISRHIKTNKPCFEYSLAIYFIGLRYEIYYKDQIISMWLIDVYTYIMCLICDCNTEDFNY